MEGRRELFEKRAVGGCVTASVTREPGALHIDLSALTGDPTRAESRGI